MGSFNILKTMQRIVAALDFKIDEYILKHSTEENKISKGEFLDNIGGVGGIVFPIGKNTYYSYKKAAGKKKSSKLSSISLSRFFDICVFTNTSADYLLGFIDTKRREQSAQMVKKDFGLSDKAMETLSKYKKDAEIKGEVASFLINSMLEDEEFWEGLNDRLPLYLTYRTGIRVSSTDLDYLRYGINQLFEGLLERMCLKYESTGLPYEEPEEIATYFFPSANESEDE